MDQNSTQDLIKSFLQSSRSSFGVETYDVEAPFSLNSSAFLQDLESEEVASNLSEPLSLPDSFEQLIASNPKLLENNAPTEDVVCTRCDLTKKYYQAILVDMKSAENALVQKLKLADHKVTSLTLELSQIKQLSSRREDKLKLELSILEEKNSLLTALLDEHSRGRAKAEESLKLHAKSTEEVEALREKVSNLEFVTDNQRRIVESSKEAELKHKQDCEQLKIVSDMLEKDKKYLESEVGKLEYRLKQQIAEGEVSKSRAMELEVKVSQLTDQIMQIQLQSNSQFETKLDHELKRVREESLKELNLLKSTARELSDREARVLRESKVSAETECANLSRKNKSLQEEVIKFQKALNDLRSEKANEITELKAELKLKSFELTNLALNHEEKTKQMKLLEIDLEKSDKELALHKAALLRIEAEFSAEKQKLLNALDECRNRLSAYEALEVQIDNAVVHIAKSSKSSRDLKEEPLLGLPTSPERRLRQAVFLAQKLLQVERERDNAIDRINAFEVEVNELRDQKAVLERSVMRAAQPTSYLVAKLEEVEKLLALSRKESDAKGANVDYWRSVSDAKGREVEELQLRLENLLKQRGELEVVRTMIEHLHDLDASERGEDSESDQESLEGEETKNTRKLLIGKFDGSSIDIESKSPANPVESDEEKIMRLSSALGIAPEMVRAMLVPPSEGSQSIVVNQERLFTLPPSSIGIKQISYQRKMLKDDGAI